MTLTRDFARPLVLSLMTVALTSCMQHENPKVSLTLRQADSLGPEYRMAFVDLIFRNEGRYDVSLVWPEEIAEVHPRIGNVLWSINKVGDPTAEPSPRAVCGNMFPSKAEIFTLKPGTEKVFKMVEVPNLPFDTSAAVYNVTVQYINDPVRLNEFVESMRELGYKPDARKILKTTPVSILSDTIQISVGQDHLPKNVANGQL